MVDFERAGGGELHGRGEPSDAPYFPHIGKRISAGFLGRAGS